MKRVYFDNSATTALDPVVLKAMMPWLCEEFGNASSVHLMGQKAKSAVEKARSQVARMLCADPREIIFTSGGTESDNLAILGTAGALADTGRHIITTNIEHPAVLNTCQALESRGFSITCLPVNETGIIDLSHLASSLREDTVLVSIMTANNEIGTLQPIRAIGSMIAEFRRQKGIRHPRFHTDAVQAFGKIPIDVDDWGVDLLTLSGHKIHGPKGVGALYVRQGTRLERHMHGGHHERDRRAGTENVPGIIGLGMAAELAGKDLTATMEHVRTLRDSLEAEISRYIPEVLFNGDRHLRIPTVSNCSFRHVDGEALMIRLDLRGICVSTGAACASGSIEPSHVLTALGRERDLARGSIRFSLSRFTTDEEVGQVVTLLIQEVAALRALCPNDSSVEAGF